MKNVIHFVLYVLYVATCWIIGTQLGNLLRREIYVYQNRNVRSKEVNRLLYKIANS